MSKWILLVIVLFPSVAFSQATVSGNFNISGNFEIGTNVIDQGIQSMKVPSGIVAGGGLVGAWLIPKGAVQGDDATHIGTLFDLTGNGYNLTAPIIGTTNQLVLGTAGTNQVGLVGVPSVNCTTNASLGFSRLENSAIASLFNVDRTGFPTNGGVTMVLGSRCRILGSTFSFGLGGNSGSGNANQLGFAENQASATQTKINITSHTNSVFVTGGFGNVVTNRWRFTLFSWAADGTLNRMENLASTAAITINQGTNYTFNSLTMGIRKTTSYGQRFNGDIACAMVFTNSMDDGTSRTNVMNWLNRYYNFY